MYRILSSRNGRFLLVLFLAIFTKLLFSRKINIKLGFNHVRLYRFSMIMKHPSHSSSPRMTRKSIKSPVGVTLLAGGYPILLSYSNKTSINKLWIWSTHLKTAYFYHLQNINQIISNHRQSKGTGFGSPFETYHIPVS